MEKGYVIHSLLMLLHLGEWNEKNCAARGAFRQRRQ